MTNFYIGIITLCYNLVMKEIRTLNLKDNEKPQLNKLTEQILSKNLNELTKDEYYSLIAQQMRNVRPILQDKEIKSLYEYCLNQINNSEDKRLVYEFARSLLKYMSNTTAKDENEQENTLDRSYRIFYEIAEKNPEEMIRLFQGINSIAEYVSPDVFFDTYLKIKDSPILDKYFGGEQFSKLEHNITHRGTEQYIQSLLSKINFTESSSCLNSSRLMNIAASIADYARNGSYSGNYNIDVKIIEALKSQANNPDSIYLLGSKANYITERLEKGYPPFAHKNQIFEISPGTLATNKKEGLFILDINDNSVSYEYQMYKKVSKQIDYPPQELVNEAITQGQDYVNWEPDSEDIFLQETLADYLVSRMSLLDLKSLSNKEIENSKIKEFINLVGTDYKIFLEDEFKFNLSKFSIQEQFYFLEYIQIQTNKSIKPVKEFTKKYGNNGFRTFLSIEQGGKEMGDKIITLGEKLPKDSAEVLFAKYAELVDIGENVSTELKNTIGKEVPVDFEQVVREHLLIKGKDMLSSYGDKAKNCEGKTCIDLAQELTEKLKHAKGSMILFASVCRNLVEQGEFDFNDFRDVELVQGKEFTKKEEELMRFMALENTKQYPDKLRDFWYGTLDEAIKNPDPKETFIAVKYKGEIAGFMRVKELDKNTLYGASFNINPNLKGSRIGTELLKKVIDDYTKTKDFTAEVYEKNPMLDVYTKKFGFEIIKEEENYNDTGAKVLQIKKPRQI